MRRVDEDYMRRALLEAGRAARKGEVPVGAVLVLDRKIIGRGCNLKESRCDPTAHAEIIAVREAAKKVASWRLEGASLYVTLEPCPMCLGAVAEARISRVVFGCFDSGRSASRNLTFTLVPGVCEKECSERLRGFFQTLRNASAKPTQSMRDSPLLM